MAEKTKKKTTEEKPAATKRPTGSSRSTRSLSSAETPAPSATPAPEPKVQGPTVDLLEPVKKVKKISDKPGLKPFIKPLVAPPVSQSPTPPAPEPVTENAPQEEAPVDEAPQPETSSAEMSGKKVLNIKPPIAVKALAEELGLKPFQLIKDLMSLQIFANLNQTVEADVVAKVCEMHGFVFERERKDTSKGHHKVEAKVEVPKAPEPAKID